MSEEYTIACLLTSESVASLEHIPFLDKDNLLHISFFQFKCCDESLLQTFKDEVNKIKIPMQCKTEDITKVEDNIFLNVVDDGYLKKTSDHLADLYASINIKKVLIDAY